MLPGCEEGCRIFRSKSGRFEARVQKQLQPLCCVHFLCEKRTETCESSYDVITVPIPWQLEVSTGRQAWDRELSWRERTHTHRRRREVPGSTHIHRNNLNIAQESAVWSMFDDLSS